MREVVALEQQDRGTFECLLLADGAHILFVRAEVLSTHFVQTIGTPTHVLDGFVALTFVPAFVNDSACLIQLVFALVFGT